MGETTIEWTDTTWNPLRGCSRISPGCQNCYAERMAARFSGPGMPYEGLAKMTEHGPRWTGKVQLVHQMLYEPLKWRKPRRVFVNSMSDLFHEDVPDDYIDALFAVMALAEQHTFQILTKRPERMAEWFGQRLKTSDVQAQLRMLPGGPHDLPAWPLNNVWLGTSIENQTYARRIRHLKDCPAVVRFISAEPLLGRLDLAEALNIWWNQTEGKWVQHVPSPIDWVIAGAESGPGARPMNEDWVRTLRDECQAAGVAFFYKQRLDANGHKEPLPELDGRTWAEMPTPKTGRTTA